MSGCFTTLVVHPADVIKTRLQMIPPSEVQSKSAKSVLKVGRLVWQQEGAAGFFVGKSYSTSWMVVLLSGGTGVLPRMMKRMPQQAITWTCYDLLSRNVIDTK